MQNFFFFTGNVRGKYIGCFIDGRENRLLRGHISQLKKNSPQSCADICYQRGYIYAGVQYGWVYSFQDKIYFNFEYLNDFYLIFSSVMFRNALYWVCKVSQLKNTNTTTNRGTYQGSCNLVLTLLGALG